MNSTYTIYTIDLFHLRIVTFKIPTRNALSIHLFLTIFQPEAD